MVNEVGYGTGDIENHSGESIVGEIVNGLRRYSSQWKRIMVAKVDDSIRCIVQYGRKSMLGYMINDCHDRTQGTLRCRVPARSRSTYQHSIPRDII